LTRAELARRTLAGEPVKRIPNWLLHVMEHRCIEHFAKVPPGEYRKRPREVYVAFQKALKTCLLDQYIPLNPLTMGSSGYEDAQRGATTGAREIVIDGLVINSPEAVCEHLEKVVFPYYETILAAFDPAPLRDQVVQNERAIQAELGEEILKAPYGVFLIPILDYYRYGYENYFMACALYPEVLERHFALQADYAELYNAVVAKALAEAGLPRFCRLDHDLADSRGTLVRLEWLEKYWLPHFARSIKPALDEDFQLIWHCDGNLMELLPRLLDCGLVGCQGFQYEAGMDYAQIANWRTMAGEPLLLLAGVSVTTTLVHGTPADVKRELDWLVQTPPPGTRLILGGSSSIVPGTPLENIETLVEGLIWYSEHGRA